MIRIISSTLALASLGALATAQSAQAVPLTPKQPAVQTLDGPIQHYVLDTVSGKYVKAGDPQEVPVTKHAASVPTYVNDCTILSFVSTGASELIDWGVKAGGASTLVDSFTFGYATTTLGPGSGGPGASLDIAFYEGTTGFGVLGTEVARFSFTGLPGSSDGVSPAGFTITAPLTVGFCLADGPIGYGYCSTDASTGPILVDIALCLNGTVDAFEDYDCPAPTGPYNGTFFLGGPPTTASFSMVITEDDGATLASTAIDNGAGGNPVVATDGGVPPVINGVWPISVDPAAAGYTMSAGFFGIGSYAPGTVILGGGQEVIADVTTFGPPIEAAQSPPGSNLYPLDVVCDLGLIGLPVTFQGILFGGTVPFALTNGVAGVVGF